LNGAVALWHASSKEGELQSWVTEVRSAVIHGDESLATTWHRVVDKSEFDRLTPEQVRSVLELVLKAVWPQLSITIDETGRWTVTQGAEDVIGADD